MDPETVPERLLRDNRKTLPKCLFCGRDQCCVKVMVLGPNHVTICDDCLVFCVHLIIDGPGNFDAAKFLIELVEPASSRPPTSQEGVMSSAKGTGRLCSFCLAPEHAVGKLATGPYVNICDKCLLLSVHCVLNTPLDGFDTAAFIARLVEPALDTTPP